MSLALMAFLLSSVAWADDPIYTGFFSNTAVKGYDTVSYFQGDGVPLEGDSDYSTRWRGANWEFESQANLDLFLADPERYAPQYGGYCAWATADGRLVSADPLVYAMVDGKLYLNYNDDVQETWDTDRPGFIASADAQYPDLVDLD
ncbi:MAG: YHS domain-containing (seleno)protein [Pseudomonadota bacterium]